MEKLWALRRVGEIIDEVDLHGKNQELINELVALATKHGILTPYTSFLADETLSVRDLASNQRRAGVALDSLQLESGAYAFDQRQLKNEFQRAKTALGSGYQSITAPAAMGAADAAPMPGGAGGYPGMGGGAYGGRGGSAAMGPRGGGLPGAGMGSGGLPVVSEPDSGPQLIRTVLNVGNKTFFWRNERWEDSILQEEQLKNVQKIKRFSPEYFELNTRFGKEVAKYLAIDGTVILVLGDTAYEY